MKNKDRINLSIFLSDPSHDFVWKKILDILTNREQHFFIGRMGIGSVRKPKTLKKLVIFLIRRKSAKKID